MWSVFDANMNTLSCAVLVLEGDAAEKINTADGTLPESCLVSFAAAAAAAEDMAVDLSRLLDTLVAAFVMVAAESVESYSSPM